MPHKSTSKLGVQKQEASNISIVWKKIVSDFFSYFQIASKGMSSNQATVGCNSIFEIVFFQFENVNVSGDIEMKQTSSALPKISCMDTGSIYHPKL